MCTGVYRCVQVCVLVEKGLVFCLHTPEAIMRLTPMSLFVLTLLVDSLMDQAVSQSAGSGLQALPSPSRWQQVH